MVLWCSYCQTFAGEQPPFDDALISHGMCQKCASLDMDALSREVDKLAPLAEFLREMWHLGMSAPLPQFRDVLSRAAALKISSADLLAGLVSPLLVQLGRRWQEGAVSIAAEHRFTAFYEALLTEVRVRGDSLHRYLDAERPEILLVNCDGNNHTVGARMVEIWLAEHGVSSRTIVPGLPSREIAAEVERWKPARVGLSISMREQLPAVQETLQRIRALAENRQVLVGGYGVKSGAVTAADLPGAHLVPQVLDLARHVRIAAAPVPR